MNKRQISESIEVGIFLALSGGFMDAYSYINRGKVFANAETGNIILMALKVCEGKFFEAVNYLIPIISFAVGVAICEIIKYRKERINMIHWRQILVLFEIFAFIVVGFLPQEMNRVANAIISMISGIQFATFPKIRGTAIATTMCTGNLKTGTQNMYRGIKTGDRSAIEKGLYYYVCILVFIAGTAIGYFAVKLMAEKAIFLAALAMINIFIMMFKEFED
nr:YoaK family protein [uncultured Lachnoanaerobaculum sp.]